jgi:hypothetical protein
LIEFQLGTLLSVSTMGAAAIGNLISDVAGVGLGSQARAPSLSLNREERLGPTTGPGRTASLAACRQRAPRDAVR